jgi:transposase
MQYIAFDSHKHYTLASVESQERLGVIHEQRIPHVRGAIEQFLSQWELGSPVALETIGSWYWIVDEIERAGMTPRLTHARKAKWMMASVNKTDRLDAQGLNRLQRNGTLPEVWIPPAGLRDQRDLPRTRMILVGQRTQLKNRIQATLAKYALTVSEVSDVFGKRGLVTLRKRLQELPEETRYTTERLLEQIERLDQQIDVFEARMQQVIQRTPEAERLMTLPGVGVILATLIWLEVGDVGRFAGPESLASYAGTTPRVHASGDKVRYGPVRPDVNHYLKWAFVEAANLCSLLHRRYPDRHVSRLYVRLRHKKGHSTAVGAVARHLAEATYWILRKQVPYRDPQGSRVSSTQA